MVIAKAGSVVIQGNNTGTIQAINLSASEKNSRKKTHIVTLISIAVEIAGIGVAIWHNTHMGAK